jgi:hypothetical protein
MDVINMKYIVPVRWIMYSHVEVEAESAQEAFDMVDNHNFNTDILYERMNTGDFVFLNGEISADDAEAVTDENGEHYYFDEAGICISENNEYDIDW